MTRVDLDTSYALTSQSWSLYVNGMDINQDLMFSANGKRMLISDPDADFASLGFVSPIPGGRLAFHIDLSRVPASCSQFTLQLIARRDAFVDWFMRSPEGLNFDAEGLRMFSGQEIEFLEFSREKDWVLRSRKIDLTQPADAPAQNRRLPDHLRELHQLAGNLRIAEGVSDVAVVIDSSASMLRIQRSAKFLYLLRALQAISLTVSLTPLKLRFAGVKRILHLGPLDDLDRLVQPLLRSEGGDYREVEPMMNLIPSALTDLNIVRAGGRIYAVSDTWFYIGADLARELRERNVSLVLVKLLSSETEDEPVRFSNPNVSLRTVVGLDQFSSPDAVVRALA